MRCDRGRDEIVVCDSNSADRTAAVAGQLGCRVVFEKENPTGRARNRGASVAHGEWLLLIDADSWPSAELMNNGAKLIVGGRQAGCGRTIRVADGPWWFRRAWESKNLSRRHLQWCPGGFILCRRDAFDEFGGFPPDHYIFEEADFVRRLKKWRAQRGQNFTVLHHHPFTASGRKGTKYGFWSWMKTAARFWFSLQKLVRAKAFAAKRYEGDR